MGRVKLVAPRAEPKPVTVRCLQEERGPLCILETVHTTTPRYVCNERFPWNPSHGAFAIHPAAKPESNRPDAGSVWFVCPYCRTRFQQICLLR